MSIFFINDGGTAIINIGGFNPPSQETVTQGIMVPPIIPNPVVGDTYFDSTLTVTLPLVAPSEKLLLGTAGNDLLTGMDDNNTLQALQGDDVLNGQGGNDNLWAGQGNDTLNGGGGNDILSGDQGQDLLTGNSGNDIFILSVGAPASDINSVDIITDFIVGEDQIGLTQGLNQTQVNLIPFGMSGTSGTLITITQSNHWIGFIANVNPGGLVNQFITVN